MLRPGFAVLTALLVGIAFCLQQASPQPVTAPPTFYRDVLPILQDHCQTCHRLGEIGPMPLVTYKQTRCQARKMADRARAKIMPPWFADPCCGRFSDDPSLTGQQIATLIACLIAGAMGATIGRKI